jgi:phage terminase large subunit-like protein
MKAGPKGTVTAPPLDLRRLPKRGGSRAIAFVERYVTLPKGTGARRRMKLRPWQRAIVHGLLDEPRPRQGLVSIPAGNGKSTLAAALGLYGLLADRVEGGQVICVASDERQARIILNTARRMVELDPALYARVQIYADHLAEPHSDSTLFALPADPGALQGWDPSMAIVDELHVVTDDTFEAMAARAGKREHSLLLAISTPPRIGDDGVMRRLVDHGRSGADPSFYFAEFAAPAGCPVDDEAAWEVANPALDDFLHRDALRATLPPKMRENAFRRYRLGQWVTLDGSWLPDGAWAACADPLTPIGDGADVVLGFDGSFSGDCTALVAVTVAERPHVHLVELWEAPEGSRDWRVPIIEVEDAIRAACRRWRVLEVAADPYRWARSLELLDAEGIPVGEYPQGPARMGPATSQSPRSAARSAAAPSLTGRPSVASRRRRYTGTSPASASRITRSVTSPMPARARRPSPRPAARRASSSGSTRSTTAAARRNARTL